MHKAGFVNIFGKPNAGKSTLLNALVGEKLAIMSPKVQTTRHRITGIVTEPDYQIVFSDTPGIIEPKYRLHEKMMGAVRSALEDADVALLVADATETGEGARELFGSLHLKVPAILLLNKIDLLQDRPVEQLVEGYREITFIREIIPISARTKMNTDKVMAAILRFLPEAPPFYPEDTLTDKPVRFFVSEIIREKIFHLYKEEVPYHAAVLITQFEEKATLTKITAQIVVTRETQKGIILGEKGKMIKELGTRSRNEIEAFLERKVFLELLVKVRDKWRDNENYLREYGY